MHPSKPFAVVIGASAGLGLALVEQLAKGGTAQIVLVARNVERLTAAITRLRTQFANVDFYSCAVDITSAEGSVTMKSYLTTLTSRVDLLINAVGASDRGTILGLKPERLEELMRVNVIGPTLAVQAIASLMPSGSAIINIGSLASYMAPSYLGGYSIAKHGLRAMTQQLRFELSSQGIHVMLVCPGPIRRQDTGSRYTHLASAAELPAEALQGGGGASLKGLDPQQLAIDILSAVKARKLEIVRPRKVRLLMIIAAIWPRLGEWILRKKTASK